MNYLGATVTAIADMDNLTVVDFERDGVKMRMMGLDLNVPIKVGSCVTLGFKATHVAVARELEGMLSISNRLEGVIDKVDNGALLCSVKVRIGGALVESIITRDSSEAMALQKGDTVTLLIKSSELSVADVCESERKDDDEPPQ